MIISINDNQLTIDGNLAGSLEDSLANFPGLTNELWVLLNTQNKERTDENTLLKGENKWLKSENIRLTESASNSEPVNNRSISTTVFRDRFTQAELMGILKAAYSGDGIVQLILLKIQTVGMVDLDSQEVINGLNYLTAFGLLTNDRAIEILS